MELKAVSSIPAASMPTKLGVKRTSGQRNRSLPMVMTCKLEKAAELYKAHGKIVFFPVVGRQSLRQANEWPQVSDAHQLSSQAF